MPIVIPAPASVLDVGMPDGAVIRVRRHGCADGPRLVLSHGNGFAIDAYYPFWRLFLRDCDVVIYDQRNHGWNARHLQAAHSQTRMVDDLEVILAAVEKSFGPRPTAGLFHSLSTTVSLLHFIKYPAVWRSLILFDPPLAPPAGHRLHEAALRFEVALSEWARRRQSTFADPAELAAYFKNTRRLRRWIPGAAELMARAITRPNGSGSYELACPPEFEAQIYLQNARSAAWAALPAAADRLLVVSSDYALPDADPPGHVCEALIQDFGIKVAPVPDTGHLLQIERPDEAARIVRAHLRAAGLALDT